MIKFLFEQLPGVIVGGAVIALLAFLYNVAIDNPSVRRAEEMRIEAAVRAKAMALIEKRNEDNVEISQQDESALCAELGGRWVPNESRCD